jgi:hypothetical protein
MYRLSELLYSQAQMPAVSNKQLKEYLLVYCRGKSKMPEGYKSMGDYLDVEPCKSTTYNPVGNIHAK